MTPHAESQCRPRGPLYDRTRFFDADGLLAGLGGDTAAFAEAASKLELALRRAAVLLPACKAAGDDDAIKRLASGLALLARVTSAPLVAATAGELAQIGGDGPVGIRDLQNESYNCIEAIEADRERRGRSERAA